MYCLGDHQNDRLLFSLNYSKKIKQLQEEMENYNKNTRSTTSIYKNKLNKIINYTKAEKENNRLKKEYNDLIKEVSGLKHALIENYSAVTHVNTFYS